MDFASLDCSLAGFAFFLVSSFLGVSTLASGCFALTGSGVAFFDFCYYCFAFVGASTLALFYFWFTSFLAGFSLVSGLASAFLGVYLAGFLAVGASTFLGVSGTTTLGASGLASLLGLAGCSAFFPLNYFLGVGLLGSFLVEGLFSFV